MTAKGLWDTAFLISTAIIATIAFYQALRAPLAGDATSFILIHTAFLLPWIYGGIKYWIESTAIRGQNQGERDTLKNCIGEEMTTLGDWKEEKSPLKQDHMSK